MSVSGPQRPLILLTGATGYVGGRLLRVLEERGEGVRCLTRRPEAVAPHRDTTTIVEGDVLELESLRPAMRGIETAYYLVHSMTAAASFEEQDRRCAANFAAAAREAGVRRIVYLGGARRPAAISRATWRVARKSAAFSPTRVCRRSSSGLRS